MSETAVTGKRTRRAAADIDGAFVPRPAIRRDRRRARRRSGRAGRGARAAPTTWTSSPRSCGTRSTASATIDELAEDFADVFERRPRRRARGHRARSRRRSGAPGLLVGDRVRTAARALVRVADRRGPGRADPAVQAAGRRRRTRSRSPTSRASGAPGQLEPALRVLHEDRARARGAATRAAGARRGAGVHHARRRGGEPAAARGVRPEPRVLFGDGPETEVFAGVGTPAAYLVDAEGKAASALTIGADTVPDLARAAAGR